MTVAELKKELRSRGQKVGGKKAELLQRLSAVIEAEELETSTANKTDDNTDSNPQQTDFADFEEYINVRTIYLFDSIHFVLHFMKSLRIYPRTQTNFMYNWWRASTLSNTICDPQT